MQLYKSIIDDANLFEAVGKMADKYMNEELRLTVDLSILDGFIDWEGVKEYLEEQITENARQDNDDFLLKSYKYYLENVL